VATEKNHRGGNAEVGRATDKLFDVNQPSSGTGVRSSFKTAHPGNRLDARGQAAEPDRGHPLTEASVTNNP